MHPAPQYIPSMSTACLRSYTRELRDLIERRGPDRYAEQLDLVTAELDRRTVAVGASTGPGAA